MTIEDDCAEYINKIEKNVGVLTYERYFDDTEWQTIVLPFDVPVANLTEQFEVAYIYNASYKGKQATIDYVVIEDSEFVLAANYPYMIRAKSTGEKSITIENATLMPTKVNSIDCSSVERKYVFTGTYNTIDGETMVNNKYYAMSGGGVKYTTSTSVSLKPTLYLPICLSIILTISIFFFSECPPKLYTSPTLGDVESACARILAKESFTVI